MKVGIKSLEDAIINLDTYKKINPNMTKERIQRAINQGDLNFMREASDFYFKISGIYARLNKHLANFYRYDYFITPYFKKDKMPADKVLDDFYRICEYVDNCNVKEFFGEACLKVMRQGCYYGYLIRDIDCARVQELSPKYCRSRFSINGRAAVEFNMRFFDETYKNADTRIRILKAYPKDFQKGYLAYKEGKLPPEEPGDSGGWYLLDPECAFKFNLNGEEYPTFISVIPHIINLDAAQELDRKKMAQKLLKIIIQKMPVDKNGDLIFDVDEARELHESAVRMLGKAIGIDVLTTFADVDVADLADKNTAAAMDELEKVERTVYNESGTAQNLFNTDGNIALEKSILDDEANLYNLIQQFQSFLNFLIKPLVKNPKKLSYKVQILPTTIYNYKDMSKIYREQGAQGGSKQLALIALGQSQLSVLATARFENEILDIESLFQSKSQQEEVKLKRQTNTAKDQENKNNQQPEVEKKSVGRQPKPDDEKSAKTIQNIESMG